MKDIFCASNMAQHLADTLGMFLNRSTFIDDIDCFRPIDPYSFWVRLRLGFTDS